MFEKRREKYMYKMIRFRKWEEGVKIVCVWMLILNNVIKFIV